MPDGASLQHCAGAGGLCQARPWDDVVASLRVANALLDEPFAISQLVRTAQFNLAGDTIPFVAENGPPDEQQYNEIAQLLLNFEDRAPLILAMDGERLLSSGWVFSISRSELRKAAALEGGGVESAIVWDTIFPPLVHRDHAAFLTFMHAYAKNLSVPYSPSDSRLGEQLLNDVPRYCILTRMLTPAFSQVKGRYVSMIAQARVTRAGLAVLQHERNEKAYPENLDALHAGDFIDPFTGKDLSYRTTTAGFVVYSVGENLSDDGGTPSEKERSGDIVWEYRK